MEKVWGQKVQKKCILMVGSEHAAASISDAAASATRELDASASNRMPRHPRVDRHNGLHYFSPNFEKSPKKKTTIDFKVIPLGEVP